MKVVHVLKRIEMIDEDIKDLKKLERSIKKNKSFTTPIYMTIEKQINILLDMRIKLLGLKIENPPEELQVEIEGAEDDVIELPKRKPAEEKKAKPKKKKKAKPEPPVEDVEEEMAMLTQSDIDDKIKHIESEKSKEENEKVASPEEQKKEDESVKLLDIALEKGTLNTKDKEKEKKKVRFFKDNFPGGEY
jgi:hypothetical protein